MITLLAQLRRRGLRHENNIFGWCDMYFLQLLGTTMGRWQRVCGQPFITLCMRWVYWFLNIGTISSFSCALSTICLESGSTIEIP
ncbi:hypothetical protein ACHAWF_006021 [Thalassiosira exigua]